MALFSLARLIQKLPSSAFREDLSSALFENTFTFLAHPQGLVRRNAARLLGRMVRKGLLSDEQERRVNISFLAITGRDEKHNWDRSFIVRREAESYLQHFHKPAVNAPRYAQSFRIVHKRLLCPGTFHFDIEAPLVARKMEAGQFVIVRPHLMAERIPLSVCDWNRERGTLSLVVASAGKTTAEINVLAEGQSFKDVVGPLGERSQLLVTQGTCVVVGGGYGTGAVIPVARALKQAGHRVIGIAGARNRENLIMTEPLRDSCDELLITTNDGSAGAGGMVTDALREVLHKEEVVYVLAIGPVPMMKAVSDLTRGRDVPTWVSLNAIMVDGTGMCGACRVSVGGHTKFACFHGPEFNGHLVDFDNLVKRQKMFAHQEQVALSRIRK
jgi:ferredoxin--NADP+ reductase